MLLLLALLAIIGAIFFGAAVQDAERRDGRFGKFGTAAAQMASLPATAIRLMNAAEAMTYSHSERFDGIAGGWSYPATGKAPQIDGYMLISRYDGTRQRHVVALMSLRDFSISHEWLPDFDTLAEGIPRVSKVADYTRWNTARFRAIHPWAAANGDLIVKDHYGPLFRLDACARKVWAQSDMMFSHSTEPDGAGGFWIPANPVDLYDKRLPEGFFDDAIAHVSADGEILEMRSLTQLFANHGMKHVIYAPGNFNRDPIHINDIQPVLSDGPYWKRGDLFLSLRRPSMILLYRPSTNEVIWKKSGPWMAQHDVDILDDHRISVFNNNAVNYGKGPFVEGVSEPVIYDFASNEVFFPLRKAMEEYEVKTFSEGLIEQLPGGYTFVEEENAGRFLILSPEKTVVAQFINRAEDGQVYRLGWSRFISAADGDALRDTLQKVDCP